MPFQLEPSERRDRCMTLFGKRPVIEALESKEMQVLELIVSEEGGSTVQAAIKSARQRDVPIRKVSSHKLALICGNGTQNQGVAADVYLPRMRSLAEFLQEPTAVERPPALLLLDGVTTPANVGMAIRSVGAAGLDAIVLPRKGCADLGPLVIKASAGVALTSPILRCLSAADGLDQLTNSGYSIVGLDAEGEASLWQIPLTAPTVFVLGSESEGVTVETRPFIHTWTRIPMGGEVESLNVACAATLVAFEVLRRRTLEPS